MILRNNTTGEYVRFESDDDPVAQALMDLRDSVHPTEGQWAQTGVEALEDAQAKGVIPSLAALIPPTAAAESYTAALGGEQPVAGTVEGAVYIPNENITGVATNSRTIEVLDASATVASLAFVAGVNATEGEPSSLTNGTVAVAQGDTLTAKSLSVGTGLADPGGLVIVTFTGNISLTDQDFGDSDSGAIDE